MNQDITPVVQAWLDETISSAPGPVGLERTVAAEVHRTPQRHARWHRLPHGWFRSMFAVTKVVVASAIVALFGGLLLAGVLTTRPNDQLMPVGASPSPTATSLRDWRPTVKTEEVAPGIVRLLEDAVGHDFDPEVDERDLVSLDDPRPERRKAARGFDHIAIDPAWEVWLHRPTGDLIRLGQPGTDATPPYWEDGGVNWLDVAPDGSIIANEGGSNLQRLSTGDAGTLDLASGATQADLRSRWTWYDGFEGGTALVSTAPDGVWGAPEVSTLFSDLQSAVKDPDFRAYPEEVWDRVSRHFGPVCDMAMTSDGTVWAGLCGDGAHGFGFGGLARFVDGHWQAVEPLAASADEDILVSDATLLEAGQDDILWVLALTNTPDGVLSALAAVSGGAVDVGLNEDHRPIDGRALRGLVLFRFDGENWSAFPWDTVVGAKHLRDGAGLGVVDHAGRLWMGAGNNVGNGWPTLISFDGESTGWHQDIGPVRDLALHPDGSVWVAGANGVFVVEPDVAQRAAPAHAQEQDTTTNEDRRGT